MPPHSIDSLPIAIRVYPQPADMEDRSPWKTPPPLPDAMFIFDTETRVDATQRLTFGSYRFIVSGRCLEEGLFYGDDLPGKDWQILERYTKTHGAETVAEGKRDLLLLTRRQFVDKLFRSAYKSRDLVIGFNLPFDLSRIAFAYTKARGRFTGGFALELWSYLDKNGREYPNPYRPRIAIKHIDSKRALIGFTGRKGPDESDRIPEGSESGEPEEGYVFRGHFLDLRTLAFALTDRGYTLEGACEAFGVEHGKQRVTRHGILTITGVMFWRQENWR